MAEIENVIKDARRKKGLSAKHVSKALNISKSTLYRLENRPSLIYASQARVLMNLYGLNIDDVSFQCADV